MPNPFTRGKVPWVRDSSHAALSLHHNQSHSSPSARCPSPVKLWRHFPNNSRLHNKMKLENRRVFHKLTSTPLWLENDYRNHLGNMIKATIPAVRCRWVLNSLIMTFTWYPAATLWSKPLFHTARVALGQLIMMSFAKHSRIHRLWKTDVSFTDSQHHALPFASQLWRHLPNNSRLRRFWRTGHRRVFYKLVKSLMMWRV